MRETIQNQEFLKFIEDITTVVETTENDDNIVNEVESLLGKLVSASSWLPIDKQTPEENRYARHSLYHDALDRFEVIALVWNPGQSTPLHDHDGTWGVEGVISGRVKVQNFLQIDTLSDDLVKLYYTGSVTLGEKSTGQLLPPADCHILTAEGNEKAVTIHIYGKKLQHFKVFEPTSTKDVYKSENCTISYNS
ncbi:cysteine dioxygenase family protein [Bacillus sp. 165]|uniref:cysteine dioxygenase family protein n=1 Tax=Bacillus sp. 165 TaxID=1529117 RepID=UPI001AD95A8D|nr:cysteine dioxygenase family protein [Bacillus sp. 165]MBO9131487.1 cysteine dioxygenase family protein [Bacillus sp. 165]